MKAYALLREAMSKDGRVAIAKLALREKEHLCTLRAKDGIFVLETMFWPDEIRATEFDVLEKDVKIRPQEIEMATSLIENLSDEFHPEQFHDQYREALLAIVEKKVSGEEIEMVPEPEPTKVVDLMQALKASVEQTKKEAPKKAASGSRQRAQRQKKAAAG